MKRRFQRAHDRAKLMLGKIKEFESIKFRDVEMKEEEKVRQHKPIFIDQR